MKEQTKKRLPSDVSESIGLIIALIAITLVFTYFNKYFFSWTNLMNILVAASLIGLVAIGETYLVIGGEVDLSAGSVAAFASVLAAVLLERQLPTAAVIIIVLAVGMMVGGINAFAVNHFNLEPFIATLATMSIFRGAAFIICDGKPVFVKDPTFLKLGSHRILGYLPIPVVILLAAFVTAAVILKKTRFGRSIYVLGGNKTAARLAGLHPQRMRFVLYMINGALACLGGMLLASRMNSGQPSAGIGLEFDAITAAVLGGVAFSGGVGSIFGMVIGVLILQSFNTGLIMMNVPSFWQYVARGLLLLTALAFDYYRKKQRDAKQLADSMKAMEEKFETLQVKNNDPAAAE